MLRNGSKYFISFIAPHLDWTAGQLDPNYGLSFPATHDAAQMSTLQLLLDAVHHVTLRLKHLNSFTTKKQTTKLPSTNFQKMLSPSYIMLKIQRLEGK